MSTCERKPSWSSTKKETLIDKKTENWSEFAKEHKKRIEEQWKNELWSDESKFEIFSSKRRQYVRRKMCAWSFHLTKEEVLLWFGDV